MPPFINIKPFEVIETLTIANNGTDSDTLDTRKLPANGGFAIYGPAAATGTLSVQLSIDEGSTWYTLQSPPGTAATVAALAVTQIETRKRLPAGLLRIHSSSTETPARVLRVVAPNDAR